MLCTPTVLRYCKRCGEKSEFESSEMFRVNAQQKNLDIWLIYKCRNCNTTWKLTVLSRINPHTLPAEMLTRYANNDSELAKLHAMDVALIKKNGAKFHTADAEIVGSDYDWKEAAEIHLAAKWSMKSKAAAFIYRKLGLSRSAFEKMYTEGRISCLSGHDLKKCKMKTEIIFRITL